MISRTLKDVGASLLAIPAMALGLLLIAVFFQVAVESSSAWWEWIVAFGLALAVTGVALVIIGMAVAVSARRMADGWVGMFSGRVPAGYGRLKDARSAVITGLAVAAVAIPAGLLLFRSGQASGMTNWAIAGLFLAAGGVLFGLLPAVPGVYFLRHANRRGLQAEEAQQERLEIFLLLAFLGIGLGLAVSFTFDDARRGTPAPTPPAKAAATTLAPGGGADSAWQSGCVARVGGFGCTQPFLKLRLQTRVGERTRIETVTHGCRVRIGPEPGAVEAGWPPRRLRDPRGGWLAGGAYREFVPVKGLRYQITIAPHRTPLCTYRLRQIRPSPRRRP